MNTDELLAERQKTHGDFTIHAEITQLLKDDARIHSGEWEKLSRVQKESIEMILHKIGRILAGNPNEPDHWDDIAGYARLVSQRLIRHKSNVNTVPAGLTWKEPGSVMTEEELRKLAPTPGQFPKEPRNLFNDYEGHGKVRTEPVSLHPNDDIPF